MKKFLYFFSGMFLVCISLQAVQDVNFDKALDEQSVFLNSADLSKGNTDKNLVNVFKRWVKHSVQKLQSQSDVIDTASGPIEYVKKGSGPVVLCLHGGFGGYDQGKLLGSFVEGFTILAPSRPGYLRTPLSVGQTPEQQADAMVSLLNALDIDRVGIIGFSAGAPVAYQLALRHPTRVWGLALECIGAQSDQGPLYELINQLITTNHVSDFSSWLLYLAARSDFRGTSEFILSLDTTLSPKEQERRVEYVLRHSTQSTFLKKLIESTIPLNLRKEGLLNDLNNLDPWMSPSYVASYSTFKTPTIIIESLEDTSGNYQEAVYVSQEIGAELISVGQSGHFIWLGERSKQWQTLLNSFLKSNKP